jgi:Predicted permeases
MSILLIIASIIWGINIIVMKILMEYLPIFLLASVRVAFSSIIIGIFLLQKKIAIKIPYKLILFLLLISFFNVGLNFYLSLVGISMLNGSSTAIINALNPVITSIFAFVFLKQKLSKKILFAIILSIFGFMISFGFDFSKLSIGTFLILGSIISYSYSMILIKKKGEELSSLVISFYSLLFGSIQLFTTSYLIEGLPFSSFKDLSFIYLLLFFIFSICGFAYIQSVQMLSINKIGPIKTSFYLNLNPIFTFITAIIFLSESIDCFQIIGLVLMVVSLIISNHKELKN